MQLNWNESTMPTPPEGAMGDEGEYIVYTVAPDVTDDKRVQSAINHSAEKAASMQRKNINDDSMYLLFNWDSEQRSLMVCVTDAARKKDAARVVICQFPALAEVENTASDEYAEEVKYWISNYLTTSQAFLQYSLVAGFCRGDRKRVELL